ncbi:SIMPL domain-containing protein [uncultured Arthrobacter sp.]|uniref:SIMPL domain-containing protein n=1 Tax=uncultured Arthrobacter sp. TaxID=114050 RepID=UPI0032171F0F
MTEHPRSIAVSGSGTAEAAPDLLTLSIGVECRRAGVEAAYGDAARASSAVTEVLRGHGVANADITTSGLNIRAEVSWQEGRGQLVSGYLASSTLRVRLRDLAASSGLIAVAVAAGGDDVRLNGLELGFADPGAVEAAAREAAWNDARGTAEHFASLAGARLGKALSVTRRPGSAAPIPLAGMQRAVASEPLTVEAGSSSVSADVDVVWELLD